MKTVRKILMPVRTTVITALAYLCAGVKSARIFIFCFLLPLAFLLPPLLANLTNSHVPTAALLRGMMSITTYSCLPGAYLVVTHRLVSLRETHELASLLSAVNGFIPVLAGSYLAACMVASVNCTALCALFIILFPPLRWSLLASVLAVIPALIVFFTAFSLPVLLLKPQHADRLPGIVYCILLATPVFSLNPVLTIIESFHPFHVAFVLETLASRQLYSPQWLEIVIALVEIAAAISCAIFSLLALLRREHSYPSAALENILNEARHHHHQLVAITSESEEHTRMFLRSFTAQATRPHSCLLAETALFSSFSARFQLWVVAKLAAANSCSPTPTIAEDIRHRIDRNYRRTTYAKLPSAMKKALLVEEGFQFSRSLIIFDSPLESASSRQKIISMFSSFLAHNDGRQVLFSVNCADELHSIDDIPLIVLKTTSPQQAQLFVREHAQTLTEKQFRRLCGRPLVG